MMVVGRPLLTTMSGSVQMVARVFQEKNDTQCKIVVTFESPDHSVALNSLGSDALWKTVHQLGARIESTRKAREKAAKKSPKQ
jgi:hypothetical protein